MHVIIVQYTDTLQQDCVECLHLLRDIYPLCRPMRVDPIALPAGSEPIASRFDETLTKLRTFQPIESDRLAALALDQRPDQVAFLDADILILRNMDDIFDIERPGPEWISAHHACACNIDSDPIAPPEFSIENCPCTPLRHPSALAAPILSPENEAQEKTHRLLNSGVFVCTPSRDVWDRIGNSLQVSPSIVKYKYPDQDFLVEFFADRWVPIGWQYNAVKLHRYTHPNIWRDEEVRALHYTVDKPWERRNEADGTAGYRGRDGFTHRVWWTHYDAWAKEMEAHDAGHQALLNVERCRNPADAAQNKLGGRELLARLAEQS
ncbi:glycosyltransferase family 8 protein [Zasmidium cellare ATCC 36951]|uniref:Glycosyltransferase family 8 protein n=1 Tax=Zasmidium cellare ATCC 36951 TaxID=1080233 RepID=A0A6A6CQQ0_ZASCE|nr:glycosyltransferase family 8 protein [Zasmidium cellare ATCC 36951]KAF2169401.1 glycosyltransferase family 8 protein [Zasmidium cellare ATCC 36951]